MKKEKERVQIKAPKLQDKTPQSVVVLINGKRLENNYYNYDATNSELNIEITENIGTYRIIYTYSEMNVREENLQLDTKAYSKFENIEEEIQTQDEQVITIKSTGEKISIQGEITKEVYKGYLYEGKENETTYDENYIVEVSNTQNVEEIKISKEKEVYSYTIGEEERNKIENDTNQSTYFKQTMINKSQMLSMLGQDGTITIQNAQDEVIQQLTKDSEEDENGNIVISYPNKEVKDIKIVTTKPVQLGEIKIYNQKAIDSKIGYSREEIEKFENLESIIKVNESINELQMNLLNTRAEAKISMENTHLTTLHKNENVPIMVTLLSNSNQYDLYKNPVINVIFPRELEIDIKNITQLNLEEQIKIKETALQEDGEGKKVLRITFEGEQENYIQNLNEGIQIAIIADINIPNTINSKESAIELSWTDENKQGENKTECPFKISSKYGVLMVNQLENYNQKQEVMETIDDEEVSLQLDAYSNEIIPTRKTQIINNYENSISEVFVIGSISEEQQAMDISFQDIRIPQNKNAKIYYSAQMQTDKNSNEWIENKDEVGKIKAYKIVLEDEIQSGESIELSYSFHIPGNLEPGTRSYIKNTLEYKYLDNRETTISEVKCNTKNQQAYMFQANKTTEALEGVKVEISAISGGQYVKDGDTVKEGQGIRYKVRVTNEGSSELSNIVLEAIHTNAIYYDLISYQEDVDFIPYTKYKIDENRNLTSKTLQIDSLQVGETKEVSYQISVKEVVDNNQTLTGEIKITADNQEEKIIPNMSNKIDKADIKATLKFLYSEDVITAEGSGVPLLASVKNISNQELQDIIVEIPLAEGLSDFTEDDLFMSGEEPYEFIECKNRIIKFRIPKIEANQTVAITVKPGVERLDLSKSQETISQYFKVLANNQEYISNDIERKITQTRVEIIATQTTNRQEKKVKDGDEIIFTFKIENKGTIETDISITDKIPFGLKVNSAILKTSEGQEEVEHEISLLVAHAMIKPNEVIEFEINTTVDATTMVEQEIENYVEINGINVETESNKISFMIELPQEDKDDSNNEDNNDNNNDDDNNQEFPGDDSDSSITYNISGMAWLDANGDGMQDMEEMKIPNMPVWLINEETGENSSETTEEDGSYSFQNVKKGNYIVVFQYDTNQYTVTAYQKEGIPQNINSDVMSSKMNIQNRELSIARTKTLVLNSQDLENIDAGFIEGKKFDLKIEKTINQVTVKNSKGTKTNSYQKSKLAKVEIDAKQIENSEVTIEYNIAVTNQGQIAGYANEIIDYLPKDLSFNQEINQFWSQSKDGAISTKELSNQIINPGETKNITLIASKKMTEENTGTIINKVKIEKYSSDYGTEEVDNNNNESQADVIISIRTGKLILYLSLTMIIITVIAIGVYFIKKGVLQERR